MYKLMVIVVIGFASLCHHASAQDGFPNRPLEIYALFDAGTQGGKVAVALSAGMAKHFGVPARMWYAPSILLDRFAVAKGPDGYTIVVASNQTLLPKDAYVAVAPLAIDSVGGNWFGVFVPAVTPKEIVSKLNAIINSITTLPIFGERLAKIGLSALNGTPADMALLQQQPRAAQAVSENSSSPTGNQPTSGTNPLATAVPAQAALAAKPSAFASGNSYAVGIEAYKKGEYATALRLLRPHANDGNAWSQMALGAIYLNGSSVPKDPAEGYKWLFLAAAAGLKEATELLPSLERELSREQVSEGKARANKWTR